jgi:2-polyprenyl-6-methoxyphenol hydroxylase-like FAD-dependent oxidoreductase
LTVPGRQVGAYPIRDRRAAAYFLFAQATLLGRMTDDEGRQLLRERFRDLGWDVPKLLDRMASSPDFYIDAVSQIELPRWSRGRIALVGDACQCVSLLSGQGSSLAMTSAFVLGAELKRAAGDTARALERYEAALRPEIARKQQMARRFARSFVPSSRLGIVARDAFVKLMFLPFASRVFVKRFLSDTLTLDAY